MTRPIGGVIAHLGVHIDGCIKAIVCGEQITIDQVLITQQFGISDEGIFDVMNALVKEAQVPFKNIAGPDAFVNK
jgi:hypothetical protein